MKWAATWENQQSAKAKTKAQISFAVTAKLISAFVFATRIVQFLFYLNPKFQDSSSFLWLYRSVYVGSGRKPHCWFSHEAAQILNAIFAGCLYGDRIDGCVKGLCDVYPPFKRNTECCQTCKTPPSPTPTHTYTQSTDAYTTEAPTTQMPGLTTTTRVSSSTVSSNSGGNSE